MYQRALLLLTYFVAAVTCQSECDRAEDAVVNNEPCFNAFLGISAAFGDNTTIITSEDLNTFCQPGCRNLVNNRAVTCDGDDSGFPEVSRFICTTDGGVSCYDVFRSPRIMALGATIESGVCADEIPDGEMCSQACREAFQNFIVEGGCCITETFQFASQFSEESLDEILSQCPVDLSRGGTCTEIGRANGLKASFGGVLLFAVMFALTTF